ncbi:MAG: hypothetical protein ACLFVR_15015 [Thiohalospira sp.]
MKTLRRPKGHSPEQMITKLSIKHPEKTWEELTTLIIEKTKDWEKPITYAELQTVKQTFKIIQKRKKQYKPLTKKGHCTFIKTEWKAGMTSAEMKLKLKQNGFDPEAKGVN